jgi:hypothetical protein
MQPYDQQALLHAMQQQQWVAQQMGAAAGGNGMGGFVPPMVQAPLQDRKRQRPQGQSNGPNGPQGGAAANGEQQQRNQPPRNNEIGEVSRVLHMRNVTPEVSQLSIQNLVSSFGRIRNIVMLRQKNQALVEMETAQSAQQLVDFFKDVGYAEIDGRRVYVRYSLHNELTAAVHTSKTLLVSMFNTQYDVSAAAQITPMIVYQIFGSYGTVEKIVVLPKNESSAQNHNRVQALVQFESKEIAENVKNMLQGQPVTLGETVTFTLDIQYSRMEEIKTSSPHNSLVVPKGGQPFPVPGNSHPAPPQQSISPAALQMMQQHMLMHTAGQPAGMGMGMGMGAPGMMPPGPAGAGRGGQSMWN